MALNIALSLGSSVAVLIHSLRLAGAYIFACMRYSEITA